MPRTTRTALTGANVPWGTVLASRPGEWGTGHGRRLAVVRSHRCTTGDAQRHTRVPTLAPNGQNSACRPWSSPAPGGPDPLAFGLVVVLQGLLAGLSLIIAIGAQNAFVLRQGLRREHVGAVVAVCVAADVALIAAGTAGLGALVTTHPAALTVARYGGAAFLAWFGVAAAVRAAHPGHLDPAQDAPATLRSVLGTTLALTFLNPHVYLDTVLLLGALAQQHGTGRWAFAAGAALASLVWFTALGFGSARLAPVLARPAAWRVLDAGVALIMLAFAVRLVVAPL